MASTNKIKLQGFGTSVSMGGGSDVVVQTMLNARPEDVAGNIEQAKRCMDAGAEVIRVSVPTDDALLMLERLVREIPLPIVADIHFRHDLAIESAKRGAAKLRINPGNIGGFEKTKQVCDIAKQFNCAIRVGVNAGSLDKAISERHDLTHAQKLALSAEQYVKFMQDECNLEKLVVSIKAHDVMTCVEANRSFAKLHPEIPLHIGITEAGTTFQGLIKSASGLGILLNQGIGDTIRISLTDDPEVEVRAGWGLLSALGLRRRGVELISCPTCARTQVDIVNIAKAVERRLSKVEKPIKVAVMGCVVNGPGEAADADVGVACGKGCATLFKHGKILRKVDECKIVEALMEEISNL